MSFPGSIPTYTGFTSTHTLQQDSHASQHNLEQADIAALATKLGTGVSTPSNNTVLRGNGSGTSGYDSVHAATDISGVLGVGNGGTGVTSSTGTGSAVLSNGGTLSAPVLNNPTGNWLQQVYPIGCIYIETTGTNPATTFGFGTWSAYAQGRTIIGVGTSDQSFAAASTGGESNHTLTTAEMPNHNHSLDQTLSSPTGSGNLSQVAPNVGGIVGNYTSRFTGDGGAHNNLPPYITTYVWQRTA